MRASVFFLLLIITVTPAFSANKSASPQIEVEEPFWDYGFVPFDYNMVHFFTVKNTGDANLKIEKVGSNCDCTTARAYKMDLSPGESTLIRLDFWTTDYYGSNVREITIESNDPLNPILQLEYGSNIGALPAAYIAEPKSLFFLPSHQEKVITLHNKSPKAVDYEIRLEADSLLNLDVLKGEIKSGEAVPVKVAISDRAGKGTTYTSFNIRFDGEKPIRTTVPVKIVRY